MELRQLKTFQAVARLLSFHRAAETLNYAPSTVSTQIKLLEEEFGVPLFDRLGKGIRLTQAGRKLVRYSQKMLDIENETLARISGREESQGALSIRIPQSMATYLLPAVISEFQEQFPRVGFDVSTCAYESLVHELKTGTTDLAFLLAESVPFSELKTELLGVEPLVIVSERDHPLSKLSSIRTSDLVKQPILLPKHDCSYKMTFEQILTEEKAGAATFMEMNSIEAIKQCVLRGVGIAMFPKMAVAQELVIEKMTILPWPDTPLETAILMIWHRDKWLSPMLKVFMDKVREVMKTKVGQKKA